jgi:hypothetical protein
LPILKEGGIHFKVDHVMQHEVKGSCCRPKKFYFIKWLDYELEHSFWEFAKKLNSKVLKNIGI